MNTLPWHTHKLSETNILIQDGDRVVGSINNKNGEWHVEILWNANDITFVSRNYPSALSFVCGVEAVMKRLPP